MGLQEYMVIVVHRLRCLISLGGSASFLVTDMGLRFCRTACRLSVEAMHDTLLRYRIYDDMSILTIHPVVGYGDGRTWL